MFIVVEGENCTGKSTLVAHLAQKLGWEVIKFSKPKGDPYVEYMKFLLTRTKPAILDRFYLGEEVYGKVWRGKSGLDGLKFKNLEEILNMRVPVTIYCETDTKEIAKRFKTRGEELAKVEEIPQILDGFNEALYKSCFNWYRFDYRQDKTYERIDQYVDEMLARWFLYAPLVKNLVGLRTRGSLVAKTLIVGERCNVKLEPLNVLVPFSRGKTAEFIAALNLDRVALTNAVKVHLPNGGSLAYELMLPCLKKVVCLGNQAHREVIKTLKRTYPVQLRSLEVIKLPHPAYVSRFTRADLAKYRRQLLWACK